MECAGRLRLQFNAALLQVEIDLLNTFTDVYKIQRAVRKKRRAQRRRWWTRQWLGPERRLQFGLYDQLMVELRTEDNESFENFLRMPSEMYDEIVRRLTPKLTKQHTWFRSPMPPAMKIAITLRHLASGTKYHSMRFGWRVPHNTISLCVKEVRNVVLATTRMLMFMFILFLILQDKFFLNVCLLYHLFEALSVIICI